MCDLPGERLVHSNECAFCFEHWAPFVIGHKDGVREIYRRVTKLGGGIDKIETVLRDLFNNIDENKDGLLTLEEKTKHFTLEIAHHRGMVEYEAAPEAKDWLAYNDINKDGKVTWEEYAKVHIPLSKWYKGAIESRYGSCDEDGCGKWVRGAVLAGKTSAIDSALTDKGEKEDVGGKGIDRSKGGRRPGGDDDGDDDDEL